LQHNNQLFFERRGHFPPAITGKPPVRASLANGGRAGFG